jgi:hypothetical protein
MNKDIFREEEKDPAGIRGSIKSPAPGGPMRKAFYSLDEVSARYGIDPWTVRMWVHRFGIMVSRLNRNGNIVLSAENAEKIGTICRLVREGESPAEELSVEKVRQHLGEGSGCTEPQAAGAK